MAATAAMPAGQEALQRVILPAMDRTFKLYIKNRKPISKIISTRKPKIQIDSIFYARLVRLLRIVIPGWRSKEAFMLALHSVFLVCRTLLSLYVADLDGRIVASLVRSNPTVFARNILKWLLISVPACYCNAMLDFLQSKLALAYRSRLTEKALSVYLDDDDKEGKNGGGQVFYKLANLDDRIKNADQMITVDIQRFSNHLAEIYSNIAKPVLDCFQENAIYLEPDPSSLTINLVQPFPCMRFTPIMFTENRLYNYQLQKNVGAEGLVLLTVLVQGTAGLPTLEGELRYTHSRLIENAEEIAFYRGEEYENNVVLRNYYGLVKHMNRVLRIRVYHGIIEEGIVNYKELAELAGYTARVSDLLDTMDEVEAGKFQKQLVSSASTEENAKVLSGRGQIVESAGIRFEKVPIVSPNGDVLIKALSFEVKRGENLVVQGPNGCGKSSLFRILGGLWPVYGGTVYKPSSREFTYIPQRPYLTTGTLRDQLIYPQSKEEFLASGKTDQDLHVILTRLEMTQMVEKEGGFDARREWRDTLSGGDKQKIAMARLFYHRPQILEFDGQGGYVFAGLDASRRLALQEERQALERKLDDVPKLQARLAELEARKKL
ncbi:hypothetical protein QFC21_004406 [Naganishia friedmannii]|uniref:Uncharacterized protein n=1 Tax=Naganishia friedmannii TaxID=89922 RepID=A0ACC2VI00_9TREE|nr:hypothetical protein QFC21_004406 [Naganishia friedmannii]